MVIGLLICEVLEEEMAHLIVSDPQIGKATFVRSDPAGDLIQDLGRRLGERLTVINDVAEFAPDPSVSLEVLAAVLRVGLHMDKELLQEGVQEQARLLDEKSDVLFLAYGLCGNVLLGIEEQLADVSSPIVLPENPDGSKIDDCVGLVLGGTEKYLEHLYKEAGTWFVTPGWLKHWETLLVKELRAPDIETVKWIFEKATYKRVLMVNTGLGDQAAFRSETEKFAKLFGFYVEEAPGTLKILEEAFAQAKGLLAEEKEREVKAG